MTQDSVQYCTDIVSLAPENSMQQCHMIPASTVQYCSAAVSLALHQWQRHVRRAQVLQSAQTLSFFALSILLVDKHETFALGPEVPTICYTSFLEAGLRFLPFALSWEARPSELLQLAGTCRARGWMPGETFRAKEEFDYVSTGNRFSPVHELQTVVHQLCLSVKLVSLNN